MFRANRPRGEAPPTARETGETPATSIESLLALSLCAVVTLASVAFLRRSSDLSRALAELQGDDASDSWPAPRAAAIASSRPRPDLVIVVSIDALRADHLELYGYERETAPNLARLGAESVVFRTVAAQSSQPLTSHKSMLTGKYPATLMLEQTGADLLDLSVQRDGHRYVVDTFSRVEGALAATFAARGFRTAAFTDGGWMGREGGFAHGFDVFDDSGGGLGATVPRALAWLETNGAEPALLFLHTAHVRCPYAAPAPFDGAFCADHPGHDPLERLCGEGAPRGGALAPADLAALADHYDEGVSAADAELGRLVEGLRARGLYERALLVVTSDHGESLGERGVVGHGGLYPEQLLVPLVLKMPASWNERAREIDEPVELVDLLPTLLALCGAGAQGEIDGRSLLPILQRGVRGRDYLVAQTSFEEGPERRTSPAKRTLLRPGRWQVVHDAERSVASFYALDRDPQALVPHPIGSQELAPLLDLLLERGRSERAARRVRPPAELGEDLERELLALGYGAALGAREPEAPEPEAAGPGEDRDLR